MDESTSLELFSNDFLDFLVKAIEQRLIACSIVITKSMKEWRQQIQDGKRPKLNLDHSVLRLWCLETVHRQLLATKRYSYDIRLEKYLFRNFYQEEIKLVNKLHNAFCVMPRDMQDNLSLETERLLVDHQVMFESETNFAIVFNPELLEKVPFRNDFFRAMISGLKVYAIANPKSPHVIDFKRNIGEKPNIEHPNGIIAFLRAVGCLNQFGFDLNNGDVTLTSHLRALFLKLKDIYQVDDSNQWYYDFTAAFDTYLMKCPVPFTYHSRGCGQSVFYGHDVVIEDARNEQVESKTDDFSFNIKDGVMHISFMSSGNDPDDIACYQQFVKVVGEVAASNNFGKPKVGLMTEMSGKLSFSIQLVCEENLRLLPSCIQAYVEKSFGKHL